MKAKDLGPKSRIGNRVVRSAVTTVKGGLPVRRVTFVDGTTESFPLNEPVQGAGVTRREIAAGPARRGWYTKPTPRHRASSGEWRGERDGTRMERLIAVASGFA